MDAELSTASDVNKHGMLTGLDVVHYAVSDNAATDGYFLCLLLVD